MIQYKIYLDLIKENNHIYPIEVINNFIKSIRTEKKYIIDHVNYHENYELIKYVVVLLLDEKINEKITGINGVVVNSISEL